LVMMLVRGGFCMRKLCSNRVPGHTQLAANNVLQNLLKVLVRGHATSAQDGRGHGHDHGHGHGHVHDHGTYDPSHAHSHSGNTHMPQGNGGIPLFQPPGQGSAELALREDLAAAHRLLSACGLDSGGYFSARLPGWKDYLTSPPDELCATVTPWNLTFSSSPGVARPLDDAVYQATPGNALAVAHSVSHVIETVSCLEEGVLLVSERSALLHGSIIYLDWEEAIDSTELAARAAALFNEVENQSAKVLIIRNHGAIAVAPTIGEAFVTMCHLNRACAVQLQLLSTKKPFRILSENALEAASRRLRQKDPALHLREWTAARRWLGLSEHGDLPVLPRMSFAG